MKNIIISALCNPVRLNLICCLSGKSRNVHQLIKNCGLSQSAVSQHLTRLKKAGLVRDQKKGLFIFYSLTDKKSAKLAGDIIKFSKRSNR